MIYILAGIVLACAALSIVDLIVKIWDRLEAAQEKQERMN